MKHVNIVFLFIFCIFSSILAGEITVTILYDNTVSNPSLEADWGFSCLVESGANAVLFDTGAQPGILFRNAEKLGKDLGKVEMIIISHHHRDHTGGLDSVLSVNPRVEVYFPASFPVEFKKHITELGAKTHLVSGPEDVCKKIELTGELGNRIVEQSMILHTDSGYILVTGCSHPGVVEIIKRAKIVCNDNIDFVFGGFHMTRFTDEQLSETISEMKALGVEKCGATHCTGEHAIEQFQNAFGDQFVEMGVGKILTF